MTDKPDLYIERKAWDQIMAAVRFQELEVQFFGRGTYAGDMEEPDPRGHYILHEIVIPPQEVSGAFTDTGEKKENIANLNFILTEAIRLGLPVYGWGFWGHSHVKMGTTPSGTDKETMLDLAAQWGRAIGAVFNWSESVTVFGAGPHPLFKGSYASMGTMSYAVEPAAVQGPPEVTEWMKNVTAKTWASTATSGNYSFAVTKVQEVINSNVDPLEDPKGYIWLGTEDWNAIKGLPNYDKASEEAFDKYDDKGWVALTPHERKLLLPTLESLSFKARREGMAQKFWGDEDYWSQYE